MKKNVLLLAAMLMFTVIANGQGFITLSAGGNFPIGEFGSTDLENDNSGFAKPGATIDLSFGRLFYKKFGITTSLRYQMNDFDSDALKEASMASSITSDPYNSFMVFVGPYVEFQLHKKLVLDLKIQGGYINTTFPNATIFFQGGRGEVTSKSASSFTGLFGFTLRRDLSEKISIGVSVDYVRSSQTFDVTVDTYAGNTLVDSQKDTFDQPIGVINSIVGISYKF